MAFFASAIDTLKLLVIAIGAELGVTLDHEDGSYDAGETVVFSTNLPAGSLTAVGALKEESNAQGTTADILYSEVTYHADTDVYSFEMPAENIALQVAPDYAEGGIMLLAADDTPWDEATEIEANTYYYYSDGQLHPFNSVMGSGGNDSYKYVRYKVNGKLCFFLIQPGSVAIFPANFQPNSTIPRCLHTAFRTIRIFPCYFPFGMLPGLLF